MCGVFLCKLLCSVVRAVFIFISGSVAHVLCYYPCLLVQSRYVRVKCVHSHCSDEKGEGEVRGGGSGH